MKVSNSSNFNAALIGLTLSLSVYSCVNGEALMRLEPFAMTDVRLLEGPFKTSQDINRKYLDSLDTDTLLKNFRVNAGLDAPGKDMAGWEAPDCAIRGHFTGHYLSALALMYASTGDNALKQRGDYMVAELAEVQRALGEGYLSAFPKSAWDVVEAAQPNWAQYYTIHKIMAGLFDQYQYCGNRQALSVLEAMASYFKKRLDKYDTEQMNVILNATEEGGMCDVLWNLYSATDNPEHRDLAIKFEKSRFMTPLSMKQDVLAGLHGNTHIPLIVGAQRRYELTNDAKYRDLSIFFWNRVVNTRCYATGGTTLLEVWGEPDMLADTLDYRNQECCKTYNLLKVTKSLINWTADPRYADYYERALFNSILGTHDNEEGRLMYYVPLKTGYQKSVLSHSCHFYCCTGTGVESHSKFNDSIYFHNDKGIYVNLFIASIVDWKDKGVKLEQRTDFPEKDGTSFIFHTSKPVAMDLNIHIPYWAADGAKVSINGVAQKVAAKAASYLKLSREWSDGDKVDIQIPMSLHTHPMPDDPDMMAIMYGPLVLAGITEPSEADLPYIIECGKDFPEKDLHPNSDYFLADSKNLNSWIKPVAGQPLTFRTVGQVRDITFIPFNRITGQRYGVYWTVAQKGSERHKLLELQQASADLINDAKNNAECGDIEAIREKYSQLKSEPQLASLYYSLDLAMAKFEKVCGNNEQVSRLIETHTEPFILRELAEDIWAIVERPLAGNTADVKPLLVKSIIGDGSSKEMEKDLRKCISTDSAAGKQHIYFTLPENSLLRNIDKTVLMTITYYSDGNSDDSFCVEYDSFAANDVYSTGGAYNKTETVKKAMDKGWHSVTIECPKARFSGRQNLSSDFRVNSLGDGDEYIADIRIGLKTEGK